MWILMDGGMDLLTSDIGSYTKNDLGDMAGGAILIQNE